MGRDPRAQAWTTDGTRDHERQPLPEATRIGPMAQGRAEPQAVQKFRVCRVPGRVQVRAAQA